jgi:predicted  nucleic acid-binding Zn-ribbon protein
VESTLQEKVALLKGLQELDIEISTYRTRIEDLPNIITSLELELKTLSDLITGLQEQIRELEIEHKVRELKLKEEEESIKRAEEKLLVVKTNKEYEAALKEITDHRKKNSALEDNLLSLMEKLDVLKSEIDENKQALSDKTSENMEQITSLNTEKDDITKKMEKVQGERTVLAERLSRDELRRYELMITRTHGPVVVRVEKGICSGCHMNLPPQLFNELMRDRDLKTCPNCSRMIYFQDEEGEQAV